MSHPAYVAEKLEDGTIKYQRQKHAELKFEGAIEDTETKGDMVPKLNLKERLETNRVQGLEELVDEVSPYNFWLDGKYFMIARPFSEKIYVNIRYRLDEEYLQVLVHMADILQEFKPEEFPADGITNIPSPWIDYLRDREIEDLARSFDGDPEEVIEHIGDRFGEVLDFR